LRERCAGSVLLQDTDGVFFGSTTYGDSGFGTLFSLSTGLSPFVALVQPAAKIGGTAPILGQSFTGTTGVSFNGTPQTSQLFLTPLSK
jgi:hypothetical protein